MVLGVLCIWNFVRIIRSIRSIRGVMVDLSIVVPVYNEKDTIEEVIRRVRELPLATELIIVDDGSTDGTREVLKRYEEGSPRQVGVGPSSGIKVIYQFKNQGKGVALREGFKHVSGKYIAIQDADLEYDPEDLIKMYELAQKRRGAVVIYGNRFWVKGRPEGMAWANYIFNKLVAWLATLLFGQRFHDVATCYKMFEAEFLRTFSFRCRGFEFCPEVTAKIRRRGVRIYEVPISYYPRTVAEGKKVKMGDAFVYLWTLVKYRFLR